MPQFAHSIYTRFYQRNRRITPAVMLTTATMVAVVLSLATTGTALADIPPDQSDGLQDCAGMPVVVLSTAVAGSDISAYDTSGSATAPGGRCSFTVSLTPPANQAPPGAPGGTTPCTVISTPALTYGGGARIAVMAVGDCEGVAIATRINVAGEATPSGGVPDSSPVQTPSGSRQALAKIVGQELIDLPMFLHYSKLYWDYAGGFVVSPRHEVYQWTNEYWHLHAAIAGAGASDPQFEAYEAWHEASWHSDGYLTPLFPDVYASSRVAVSATGNGGYYCDFRMTWGAGKGSYPRLHYEQQCWAS